MSSTDASLLSSSPILFHKYLKAVIRPKVCIQLLSCCSVLVCLSEMDRKLFHCSLIQSTKCNIKSTYLCNMQIFQHTTKYQLHTSLAHTIWFSVILTGSNTLKIDNYDMKLIWMYACSH
jgi:hypothetical protein